MKYSWMLVLLIAGCAEGSSDDDDDGPQQMQPKASSSEIKSCKDSCNQLKFFDCNDSVEQAGCYLDCEGATSSQIELFTGCVTTDICDATCSTHIRPATMTPVESGGDACAAACGRLAAESCLTPDLAAGCNQICSSGTVSDRGYVLYCEARRTGCQLPSECEAEVQANPVDDCKSACDQLAFFDCIAAPAQATCRNLCGTESAATVENFTACATAGSCNGDECYRLLDPSGSTDVEGCRRACDDLSFFSCLTPAELTDCRSVCSTATSEKVETFKSCTRGSCQDNACYLELKSSS